MANNLPPARPRKVSTRQIDSTPQLIYGFDNASFVHSIFICNTTNKEIFVSLNTLEERGDNVISPQLYQNQVFAPYETRDLLKGSVLIMQPGDLVYANSSFSGDRFDSHVSSLELTEVINYDV
jgi:hypothetical protein